MSKRPRRPIKLTKAEYRVVKQAVMDTMTNSRKTNAMSETEYIAGIGLVTHLANNDALYKLGHNPAPAIDPDS